MRAGLPLSSAITLILVEPIRRPFLAAFVVVRGWWLDNLDYDGRTWALDPRASEADVLFLIKRGSRLWAGWRVVLMDDFQQRREILEVNALDFGVRMKIDNFHLQVMFASIMLFSRLVIHSDKKIVEVCLLSWRLHRKIRIQRVFVGIYHNWQQFIWHVMQFINLTHSITVGICQHSTSTSTLSLWLHPMKAIEFCRFCHRRQKSSINWMRT